MHNDMNAAELRGVYTELARKCLLGPGSEEKHSAVDIEYEIINTRPEKRYILGMLYPVEGSVDETEDEPEDEPAQLIPMETAGEESSLAGVGEDAEGGSDGMDEGSWLDNAVNQSAKTQPSSMGLSCVLQGDLEGITVQVEYATYRKAMLEDVVIRYPGLAIPREYESYLAYDGQFLRLVREFPEEMNAGYLASLSNEEKKDPVQHAFIWAVYQLRTLSKKGMVRVPSGRKEIPLVFDKRGNVAVDCGPLRLIASCNRIGEELRALTVMIVNESSHPIFQPKLTLKVGSKDPFRLADITPGRLKTTDAEDASMALLYRNQKCYASGLGVSADWDVQADGTGAVYTDFFPQAEVPQMDFSLPKGTLPASDLSMKGLSNLVSVSREEKLSLLTRLVTAYQGWIDGLGQQAEGLETGFQQAARNNIGACKQARERMLAGIRLLRDNDVAYKAFELANCAMFMQRVQLRMQQKNSDRECYPDDDVVSDWLVQHKELTDYQAEPDSQGDWAAYWRPFQLAFLLMSLPDIVEEQSLGRELLDLIWFPTGGGKTEAYLGVTAFTICWRRLAYDDDVAAGTSVIMRYTLRLLTSQQFSRASTLICALEFLRRHYGYEGESELGEAPITIGLWIGRAHTPNNLDKASYLVNQLEKAGNRPYGDLDIAKAQYNHFQVLKCPWCGTSMVKDAHAPQSQWGYHCDNGFYMRCPNQECAFGEIPYELPLQVVDEELYSHPPTLLFATVDKFALISWKAGKTASFFGYNAEGKEHRPPELIIQDELHLIAGALGSMAGLYEVAIDEACSCHGAKPKIIASTATARRVKEQCALLYDRQMVQFPPSGLEAGDSFFAKEKTDAPGRLYLGMMAAGLAKTDAEARILGMLLELPMLLKDLPEEMLDKIWTLTAYFGSIRELGKAQTMVADDIRKASASVARYSDAPCRYFPAAAELTSRVKTSDLNRILDCLEKIAYSKENRNQGRWAVNLLLATNMISVGIDVPRLNIMLVVGEPKLTSEYIQSTSRIGRKDPGMAFVMYNPVNSRDRSFYERFKNFHQGFYRQVEPSVVTPFSAPARKRALHAVLVAMMRTHFPERFSEDQSAIKFSLSDPVLSDYARSCESFLVQRIRSSHTKSGMLFGDKEIQAEAESAIQEIREFFARWDKEAASDREGKEKLYFGDRFSFPDGSYDWQRVLLETYDQRAAGSDREGLAIPTMQSMRNVDRQVRGLVIEEREKK